MKRIFAFDIDGTLVDSKTGYAPQSTIDALKELAKDENNILAIATGRTKFVLDGLDSIIDLFEYKVTTNGQVISSKSDVVFKNPFPKEQNNLIFEFLKQNEFTCGLVGMEEMVFNRESSITDTIFKERKKLRPDIPIPRVSTDFHLENEIVQLWLLGDSDTCSAIEKEFPDLRCVSWGNYGYDVIPRGISKASGVKMLKDYIDSEEFEVYCFGDSNNDIEMIEYADVGVAMGNALPRVKEVADYVTTDVDKDGIKNALIHFGLIKE